MSNDFEIGEADAVPKAVNKRRNKELKKQVDKNLFAGNIENTNKCGPDEISFIGGKGKGIKDPTDPQNPNYPRFIGKKEKNY